MAQRGLVLCYSLALSMGRVRDQTFGSAERVDESNLLRRVNMARSCMNAWGIVAKEISNDDMRLFFDSSFN